MDDVIQGLSARPRSLPYKYFYDERGSALFDQITRLDAYYPTRTETAIMEAHGDAMADAIGDGAVLIEYGSGSSQKTRLLLDRVDQRLAAYVPIDISSEHLLLSAEALRADHPGLQILPLAADYSQDFDLPALPPHSHRVVYFPGSTIGNFEPEEGTAFLQHMAEVAGPGGGLLLGSDRIKHEAVLLRAYDDEEGVTGAFNLNLLARINRELDADFDLSAWRHEAVWNASQHRIEMYLVSQRVQTVRIGDRAFTFGRGERIHTENSHKYAPGEMAAQAAEAGWQLRNTWTDERDWFAVELYTLPPA